MSKVQELGRALREQRVTAGLSQQTVCRSAGVARSWLSKVEAGRHGGAEVQKLLDLATVLGLTVDLVPVDAADGTDAVEPAEAVDPVETAGRSGGDPFEHLFD